MPEIDDPTSITPTSQTNAESSDSEDQFTDAQSAPRSPQPTSPKPGISVEPASNDAPSAPEALNHETSAADSELELEDGPATPREDDVVQPKTQTGEAPAILEDAPTPISQSKADVASDSADAQLSALPVSHDSPGFSLHNGEAIEDGGEENEEAEEKDDDDDNDDDNDDDAFGDDFDDFEEGGDEDDFDDFDNSFQQPDLSEARESAPPPQQAILPFPIPDFNGENSEDAVTATDPYLTILFPPESLEVPQFPPPSKNTSAFTTPRSASLWSQLVAPPPLAPPDWIRSRTRRLFLVSLGVPVDLDEILPASKQKKLILPSLNIPSSGSPRTSSDSRSVSRLRQGDANSSSASVDTQGKPRKRKGPPPQPELDMVAARHLCLTTDEALDGMTDEELKSHLAKLESLQGTAKEVLEYWQKRTDEKVADRETFEGVIENLVKHARKVRK